MNSKLSALLVVLLSPPLTGFAAEQLIPAGSLIACTVSEQGLSSKTESVGDPVLCQVGQVELYGRSTLPYGSYMEGRFEDYKDPGHFVGKGWMELKFDRMIIQPNTVIPVDARVVSVPGYNVDRRGHILGKGHPVRDAIDWSIPILWPIDLLNLPRRGPRPTLKQETRLTLKVMDDFGVPMNEPQQQPQDSRGLLRRPTGYEPPPPPPQTRTVVQTYVQPVYVPAPPMYYVPAPPPPKPVYYPPGAVVRATYWPPYY